MTLTISTSIRTIIGVAMLAATADAAATDSNSAYDKIHNSANGISLKSPLVEKVRAATAQYRNINVAIAEGWVKATPCVTGPNSGAMGVHLVLPARVGDGELQADQPEALIYEPLPNGRMRLVGVEFIVIAEQWNTNHPNDQPKLDGHLLHLVGAPNRYRLPAFYEMHVWAWARNPEGNFTDWNPLVSCDSQPEE